MTDDLLAPTQLRGIIEELGFELVDVRASGPANRRLVRIRIDVPGGGRPGHGVSTDDCRVVSRALEQRIEAAGLVGPQWTMEVSSPGIERPIRFVEHWRRYVGRDVRLKAAGVAGTPTARIVAVPDDEHVEVAIGGESRTIALAAIKDATLVMDWSLYGKQAGEP